MKRADRRRRWTRVLATTGTAALIIGMGPAAALAGTGPAGPGSDTGAATAVAGTARQVAQRSLVDAATVVRSGLGSNSLDGMASIVIDRASATVWWKGGEGALPASARAVLRRARGIAPIRVADARYSRSQLLTASATLEARLAGNPRFAGIKAQPDGSGLIVKFEPTGNRAAVDPAAVPDVGVATTVSHEQRLAPVSRLDDHSPWSGGAVLVNATLGVACTAGFGVNTPSGPAILTAGHCGNAGDRFQDAAGEFIGNVGGVDKNFDVEVIPTGAVSNRMYVGGRDSGNQLTVTSGGAPFVGEVLCQSGNTSAEQVGGPVCNLKVLYEDTDSQRLWEAQQQNGQTAARPGDSGGPVYDDRGDGTVIARGTNTRVAGSTLGFGGFDKAQQDFGVSIPGGGAGGVVQLYQNCDYGGWQAGFSGPGDYRLPQIQAAGGVNDDASAIKVAGGYRATVYEHDGFTGRSITLTADDPCFVAQNFNDIASSLRIERV